MADTLQSLSLTIFIQALVLPFTLGCVQDAASTVHIQRAHLGWLQVHWDTQNLVRHEPALRVLEEIQSGKER